MVKFWVRVKIGQRGLACRFNVYGFYNGMEPSGCHSMMDLVTIIVVCFACSILRLKRKSSHMKSMQQTKVCLVDLSQSNVKTLIIGCESHHLVVSYNKTCISFQRMPSSSPSKSYGVIYCGGSGNMRLPSSTR